MTPLKQGRLLHVTVYVTPAAYTLGGGGGWWAHARTRARDGRLARYRGAQ